MYLPYIGLYRAYGGTSREQTARLLSQGYPQIPFDWTQRKWCQLYLPTRMMLTGDLTYSNWWF